MADCLPPARLLVIDDEPGLRSLLAWRLRARGLEVHLAQDGQEGLECLRRERFDVVITDVTMPRLAGLGLLEIIKRDHPATEVIVMTGFSTVQTAVHAMRLGALDFLLKPFRLAEILAVVDRGIRRTQCKREEPL